VKIKIQLKKMTKSEKQFKIVCEKFIQSPPKYRMKIVLPQLIESLNQVKLERLEMLSEDKSWFDEIGDKVSGWFGGTGMNTVWERVIDGILDGMGLEEGIMRDTVSVVLSNAKWTEIPGILTDCGKFSDLIVAQIPEIVTKYVARQFVDEDILTVALRKTIVDSLATTEFAQSMKGTVRQVVCNAMGWLGGLFGDGVTPEKLDKYRKELPAYSRGKDTKPVVFK
jgi:hypothetical protein